MSMETTYEFSIVIAPKGEYVPPVVEEPVANETVEEEEVIEEAVLEENTTEEAKPEEKAAETTNKPAPAAGPAFVFDASAFEIPKRPPR